MPEGDERTHRQEVMELGADGRLFRLRDLAQRGIHPMAIRRMERRGTIRRLSRGVYQLADAPLEHQQSLAEVAVRAPHAVVCLISAAQFHRLTVAPALKVWIAIRPGERPPRMDHPPVRGVIWRRPDLFEVGVETHRVAGVELRVTGAARTVVDHFRALTTHGVEVEEETALDCFGRYVDSGRPVADLVAVSARLGFRHPMLSTLIRSEQVRPTGSHGTSP